MTSSHTAQHMGHEGERCQGSRNGWPWSSKSVPKGHVGRRSQPARESVVKPPLWPLFRLALLTRVVRAFSSASSQNSFFILSRPTRTPDQISRAPSPRSLRCWCCPCRRRKRKEEARRVRQTVDRTFDWFRGGSGGEALGVGHRWCLDRRFGFCQRPSQRSIENKWEQWGVLQASMPRNLLRATDSRCSQRPRDQGVERLGNYYYCIKRLAKVGQPPSPLIALLVSAYCELRRVHG